MDSSQLVFPNMGNIWVGSILKVPGRCDILAPCKRPSDLRALLVHQTGNNIVNLGMCFISTCGSQRVQLNYDLHLLPIEIMLI